MDLGLLVSGLAVTQQWGFQGAVQCPFCFLFTQALPPLLLKEPMNHGRDFKCKFQYVLALSGFCVSAYFIPLCLAGETKGQMSQLLHSVLQTASLPEPQQTVLALPSGPALPHSHQVF